MIRTISALLTFVPTQVAMRRSLSSSTQLPTQSVFLKALPSGFWGADTEMLMIGTSFSCERLPVQYGTNAQQPALPIERQNSQFSSIGGEFSSCQPSFATVNLMFESVMVLTTFRSLPTPRMKGEMHGTLCIVCAL